MEKSSQGSLDTSSGCGQGSSNTYDGPDTRVTIHHVPQTTNSLEKSNYVSSYVGKYNLKNKQFFLYYTLH